MEEIYSPSDVKDLLGIDSSTLRKYATHLEGHGYQIHRNAKGHRSYFEKDVDTLRQLIKFNKQDGMTIEQSALSVMTLDTEEKDTTDTVMEEEDATVTVKEAEQTTNDQDRKQDCHHEELLERIEHLEQINLDLIKHLKEKAVREASLEEKLNHILRYVQRTEQLMAEQSKRIEEETRNQIAAASQKKWWQWWK
ncbi:MerR family transcriptional regulator [Neobacillus cucumis]|uniref:HTH merR-type domain-containing protein n=1 Tax=Neobacillus cucumis TaxID=1740721 RepID=A0A2N5H7C8_9BACI|nr:MerR family transcriptional regulator [Neobacillus cucumis]PLS01414.1 hypothetical protein CVD27_25370 [Neobacillus cucumis]